MRAHRLAPTVTAADAWRSGGRDRTGELWAGRRVTVVGLGRSGIAASRWLTHVGARVTATDAGRSAALDQAADALRAEGVESVELGGHTRHALDAADVLVVSPGVPETAAPIRWAREQGRPILSEIEVAFRFCPAPLIAVTGTNGKSTAVSLLAAVLRAARRDAVACGNLGTPFCSVLERLTPESVAVVEVSSFQLTWCEQFRPRIGVFLNLGTNHLDRHASREEYLAAKARLFRCQTPDDWAVLNAADPAVRAAAEAVRARRVWFGAPTENPPGLTLAPQTLAALGPGAQAVLQVARLADVPDPLTWQTLRMFRGLEHRLEHVATVGGVRFINDSKSTTPDSVLHALAQTRGDLIAIVGGRDKGMDFAPLRDALARPRVKGIVLIGETRPRLRAVCGGQAGVRECTTLDEAVRAAAAMGGPGATVLFSPGCASFDMFRDFEERGRAFKTAVQSLAAAA